MPAPIGPFKFHPASGFNPQGVRNVPLALGADVDLTDPAGQTGGYMARAVLIGSTAGNLGYYDQFGLGPFVQAVAANYQTPFSVSAIVNATTTAATVSAVL